MTHIGIRNLPPGWITTTLGEVAQPTRPRVVPSDYPNLPYVGLGHLEAHTMRLLSTALAGEMKSAAVHFYPGDVLYGRLRPYLNKVLCPDFEGLCSAEFIVLPRQEHACSRYLQYFLNSAAFVSFASHLKEGDRPRVDFAQIAKYPFPLAPLPEQDRIVAEIEKQFTRLDAAVIALRRVQANLKRYRTAVLKAACEGRLVPTEAELARRGGISYETGEQLLGRVLLERRTVWEAEQAERLQAQGRTQPSKGPRSNYPEPDSPASASNPTLPEGWTLATIDQLASGVDYGTSAKSNEDAAGVPVLRMGNILNGALTFESLKFLPTSHHEFPELHLQPGDLLFNRTNSAELVGKSAIYRGVPPVCSFASYLIRVRFCTGFAPDFAGYFLNSPAGRAWITSVAVQQVGQANVSGSKLKSLVIPLPPEREQTRIVAEAERRLSMLDELDKEVRTNLVRAERLRQAVLLRAFEGKLVPQDSEDQPASALLNCIRAEPATALNGARSRSAHRESNARARARRAR